MPQSPRSEHFVGDPTWSLRDRPPLKGEVGVGALRKKRNAGEPGES